LASLALRDNRIASGSEPLYKQPMRLLHLAVFSCFSLAILSACKPAATDHGAPRSPTPLPVVAVSDVPPPASLTVTVERGSNLRSIADWAYGHENFSGFLAVINGIADPGRINAGAVLRTPSLAVAFHDAGLDARYQPAINALAKACTDYYQVEPDYLVVRGASGITEGVFSIPTSIKTAFGAIADTIDAVVASLQLVEPPHSAPRAALGQLGQASAQIRELASGRIDGYGYDYDLVGKRLGLGFTDAIIWTKQGHR
jgi:hypothetical protein